jgi:hypothetical protein
MRWRSEVGVNGLLDACGLISALIPGGDDDLCGRCGRCRSKDHQGMCSAIMYM